MKDNLKYQYKSPNLHKIEDMFNQHGFGGNGTKKSLLSFQVNDYAKRSDTSLSSINNKKFVKNYNKILNEFCIGNDPRNLRVDLDEKLNLNYLQSQLDCRHYNKRGQASRESLFNEMKFDINRNGINSSILFIKLAFNDFLTNTGTKAALSPKTTKSTRNVFASSFNDLSSSNLYSSNVFHRESIINAIKPYR